MPIVNIEPTREHPVPYDTTAEEAPTLLEQMAVAGNTAELQVAMGATLETNLNDMAAQQALLEDVVKRRKTAPLKTQTVAFAAAQFLREYASQVALDVAQVRSAVTYKLMEIANCGDIKFELKALELLGKHSDVGLFTNRSEITINYKDPQDLEDAIKERVKRLLNADIIDVTPVGMDLDEELGIAGDWDEGEEGEEGETTPLMSELEDTPEEGEE